MLIEFKTGTLADLETLLILMREYYEYDQHIFDESKARGALSQLLNEPTWGYAWLILDNGEVAGYMVACFGFSLEFGGRDAFLDELYLRQAYRGRGIGTQAVQHMIQACHDLGINALHLEVMPNNQKVIALYERMGFEARGSSLMSKHLQPES